MPVAAAWEDRALDRSLAAARERSSTRARRLVDAARALASERGSSEFTVAEVAARADISVRTFYRHFAGRDELLLALFEEEVRQGVDLMAAAMDGARTPLRRVRRFVVGLCNLLETGEGYASLLVREYLQLGERRPEELRVALDPFVGLLEAELRAAADAGELRPVDRHDAVVVFTAVLAHVHASILFATEEDGVTSSTRLWEFCHAALEPRGTS